MIYNYKNLSVNIESDYDEDIMGECTIYISLNHRHFFTEGCHFDYTGNSLKSYDPIYEHDYGEIDFNVEKSSFRAISPDIGIMYFSWLLSQNEKFNVNVNYCNPYWLIHDMQHAENDESGCTVYVDSHIEAIRIVDALKLFKKEGYKIEYNFLEELEESFYERFEVHIDLEEFKELEYE